jgi:hypothetical protein
MSPQRRGPSPATAGMLLLTVLVLGGAAGAGVGSLVGAFGLFLTLGLFLGLLGGIAVVYTRFRDL